MKHSEIKIVAGLGNPGKKYSYTLHNAGFLAARAYAGEAASWKNWKDLALVADCGTAVLLPQTYMNNSGIAVKKFAGYKNALPEEILAVCDDFSVGLGELRIRKKGSGGGQKGLQSIIDNLGSDSFARLRIGIGPLDAGVDPSAYVLSELSGQKKEQFMRVIEQAALIIDFIVKSGLDEAMNKYNSITVE